MAIRLPGGVLVVQQWVTVDNIAAEEDGGLGFVSGEPFDDEVTDDPFKNDMMGFIESVDTMILGANTYNEAKGGVAILRYEIKKWKAGERHHPSETSPAPDRPE
ncbi:hypothetical protein ACWGR4_31780 [Embleya sp. NPDC055664]